MASRDENRSLLARAQITQPSPYHHRRGQHNQFLPHATPVPPPAPPDQDDIHFFNHLVDMHPPCLYSPPSLTGLSEADLSDTLLMEFISTPIDDFFDSSLPSALGSGIDISRCDGNNVSHDGGISNEVKMPKNKVPRGLLLFRDEVYDIDGRPDGELPPQLEVRPIAKYVSDPGLVLGRRIAVNSSYICYGLKMGNIRVLNINSALRSLLRGHTQRITDMAFFADDVHILASASSDGQVFVWKINEGPDEEDKAQISGNILTALQIIGEEETVHPRLCWHPHKQEILMVAIGNRIFKVNTTKVGKGKSFSAEEPLKCPANRLLKGVQIIGKHDAMITDLSMCSWMARLASASTDGMVKIWEDHKPSPVIVLQPYGGRPVNSVTFFTAPHQPDHIVLFTGGPLNREIKIWTSTNEDGWLFPSDSESWQCTQSLELKSSSEESVEHAFFIQIVAVSPAGVILLANSKKNVLYALHIDCGQCPESTYMASIAEFTVTMPILSLTGTSQSLPDGGHIVQIYCVQEQAIQQYALAMSQCPPPIFDNRELEEAQYFDSLNDQIFGNFESALRMKPDIISCSPTLVPPICPGTVGSMPATVHTVHVYSSEVTGFPEATTVLETKRSGLSSPVTAEQISSCSPPLPLSPRLSQRSSGFRSPPSCLESNTTVTNHKIDHEMSSKMVMMKGDLAQGHSPSDDMCKNNHIVSTNDIPVVPDPPTIFKLPSHLITPSDILSKAPSSTETQISQTTVMVEPKVCDMINNETDCWKVEVKVVGEAATNQNHVYDLKKGDRNVMAEHREEFYSQASDVSIHVARDYGVHTCRVEVARLANNVVNGEERDQPSNNDEVAGHFTNNDFPMLGETENSAAPPQSAAPPAEVMGQKGTASQPSGPSFQPQSLFNSTDSSNDSGGCSGAPSGDAVCCQFSAMQEMLDQLVCMQKEMQKQIATVVPIPFNQEGRRLEASLGRNMENAVKAYEDALMARFLEENAKHDKLEQECSQQITSLINNCLNRDFPSIPEKAIKQKLASVEPVVVRALTPIIEKSVSSAITESFQKGVGDKAFNQLEKGVISKLEAVVARQIQSQFQTSGKQALQDSLRASLETSLIPDFELLCKAMFKQVDVTVQIGLMKHITTMQQQFESAHSPLTIALRDALNSASSISQVLCGELTDGQQTLMAIATAGAGSKGVNTSVTQLSSGSLAGLHEFVEVPIDPTQELSRLLAENKCEEAFTASLHKSDVSIVSWLCSQVDLQEMLPVNPPPLSQGVLLALLQQLAWDIGEETSKKIGWMTDIAVVINPLDPMITVHVRPICEQVYQILNHQRSLQTVTASDAGSIRLLMHAINSLLTSCK